MVQINMQNINAAFGNKAGMLSAETGKIDTSQLVFLPQIDKFKDLINGLKKEGEKVELDLTINQALENAQKIIELDLLNELIEFFTKGVSTSDNVISRLILMQNHPELKKHVTSYKEKIIELFADKEGFSEIVQNFQRDVNNSSKAPNDNRKSVALDANILENFANSDAQKLIPELLKEKDFKISLSPKLTPQELLKNIDVLIKFGFKELLKSKIDKKDWPLELATSSTCLENQNGKSSTNQDAGFACELDVGEKSDLYFSVSSVITRAILETEEELATEAKEGGSSLCVAATDGQEIVVANLGDSFAGVVMKNNEGESILVFLSEEQDANSKRIVKAIKSKGGEVTEDGCLEAELSRVEKEGYDEVEIGSLACLGSVGDAIFEKKITQPDFYQYKISDLEARFQGFVVVDLLTATDGITKLDNHELQNHFSALYKVEAKSSCNITPDSVEFKTVFEGVRPREPYGSADEFAKSVKGKINGSERDDDVTVSSVSIEYAKNSEKKFMCAAFDGHGESERGGNEGGIIAQTLCKKAQAMAKNREKNPVNNLSPRMIKKLQHAEKTFAQQAT